MTINLTVKHNSSSSISKTVCNSYTLPSGKNTITQSGIYNDTIPNYNGCDSLMTINLNIIIVDTSVIKKGDTLIAKASGLSYQWIDCDLSYDAISGANKQIFIPLKKGNYAVELTQNICIDTSSCYYVSLTAVEETPDENLIIIFPNPSDNAITILSKRNFNEANFSIYNLFGQILLKGILNGTSSTINIEFFPVYFINKFAGSIVKQIISNWFDRINLGNF